MLWKSKLADCTRLNAMESECVAPPSSAMKPLLRLRNLPMINGALPSDKDCPDPRDIILAALRETTFQLLDEMNSTDRQVHFPCDRGNVAMPTAIVCQLFGRNQAGGISNQDSIDCSSMNDQEPADDPEWKPSGSRSRKKKRKRTQQTTAE